MWVFLFILNCCHIASNSKTSRSLDLAERQKTPLQVAALPIAHFGWCSPGMQCSPSAVFEYIQQQQHQKHMLRSPFHMTRCIGNWRRRYEPPKFDLDLTSTK
ncbi:hypothetical protein E1B28_012018 [Marasmius oreades]|uniref:Secreted protein n=1 Tax=Marasmius oreades TaxID=181124 RepID=A0A9P7UN85_9AGAR|nr:uncharacterized protein E1B28_012018 [Marasmius oreades]KAG7087978.1 hypothetical protein E1B28_012018 [Marasmius oreades]